MINNELKMKSSAEILNLMEEYMDLKNYTNINSKSQFKIENGQAEITTTEEFEYKGYLLKKDKLTPLGYRCENFIRYEYYLEPNTNELYIYRINIYKNLNEIENIEIHKKMRTVI